MFGSGAWGLRDLGFRISRSGFRVWGFGFKVWGCGVDMCQRRVFRV